MPKIYDAALERDLSRLCGIIDYLRRENGLTAKELADTLEICRALLSSAENCGPPKGGFESQLEIVLQYLNRSPF